MRSYANVQRDSHSERHFSSIQISISVDVRVRTCRRPPLPKPDYLGHAVRSKCPTGEWLFGIPSFGRALSVESWRSPKQHRDRNCRRTSIPLLPPQVCLGHSTASSSSVLGLPRAICSSVEPPGQCTNVVGDKMHCGLRCWRSSWLKTWAHHSQSARRNY